MKKPKYIFILILPLMWISYCLFELFSKRLSLSIFTSLTILPTLMLLLISYLFFKISKYFKHGLSKKLLFLLFILLFFIDQGSKLIIKIFFFEKKFYIISNLLSFNPIINTKGSWLNVRFNININFIALISINFIALFLFTEIYRYYNAKEKNFFIDLCYIFILVGSICSLIDKIFYGGSLDFIGISNLFIADFKDIYINLAIFMFIIVTYNNDINNKSNDESIKISNFFKFTMNDVKKNILKQKTDS